METAGYRSGAKRRKRRCLLVAAAAVLLLVLVVGLSLGLTLSRNKGQFKHTFIEKCEEFKGSNCEKLWEAFSQAYVGRDPCDVPLEAYDQLFDVQPFIPACNRAMFWSKTKDVVHGFTENRDCHFTMEDTLLGSMLDNLTWCGKKGSRETFTTGCPGWTECENNPVRSFWGRASAGFADAACGKVAVMLNGSIQAPFSNSSIFGSIEVKRLKSTRVKSLTVVLVTENNPIANCKNPSLMDLENSLDDGIQYSCKEVDRTDLLECGANSTLSCGDCW